MKISEVTTHCTTNQYPPLAVAYGWINGTNNHLNKLWLALVLMTLVQYSFCHAQSIESPKDSKVSLYFDNYAGLTTSAALNLEYRISESNNEYVQLYGHFGHGYLGELFKQGRFGEFIGLTILMGKRKHHFEPSGGIFIETDKRGKGKRQYTSPFIDLGYRFQKPEGGFLLKACLRAKANTMGIGIGLGYAFKNS